MDWRTGAIRMKTFNEMMGSSAERLQMARDKAKTKANRALAKDSKSQAIRDKQQKMRSTYTYSSKVDEVYDPEVQGRSQIRKTGEGGRIRPERKKTEPEKRRMKAAGGGKMVPAKDYKPRADIGKQRQQSDRVQAPTKERGSAEVKQSYADKVKAERKKAAQARIAARKSGGEVKKDTTSSADATKQASKLLAKKKSKPVSPDYKPAKASGYTRKERMAIHRKGETIVRNAFKDQETARYKKETGQNPDAKGRTKIMGRVHKRMSENYQDPEHSTTYGSGSAPTSGTQGGTTAAFKKRPSTGLAKRATQSIKNAGKNTAGSTQKPDGKYRIKNRAASPKPEKGGALAKRSSTDMVRSAVKSAAQKRSADKKPAARPMLGTAQRPDLSKRKAISGGSSAIQKKPQSKPATQSGIKPVKVTVMGPKKVAGSGPKKALAPAKNNTKVSASSPNKPLKPAKEKVKALPPATSSKGY